MKRLMAIIAALVLAFGGIAFAAVVTGTFGDRNSSGEYRMKVDTDGVVTLADDTTLTGGIVSAITTLTTSGNIGVGTTSTSYGISVGTVSVGGTLPASSVAVKGSIETDTDIYVDKAIYVTRASAGTVACFISVGGKVALGHCIDQVAAGGTCNCGGN